MEETRQEMMFESSADSYIDTAKKVCQVSQRKFLTYGAILRGREGVSQNVTIVLIGGVSGTVTRGEGVQKSKNYADVI